MTQKKMDCEDIIEECFHDGEYIIVRSNDQDAVKIGETIRFPNTNCEHEYDCIDQEFKWCTYAFIVSVEIIDVDCKEYIPEKSNNGGHYAFADAVITKVHESAY